MVLTIISVLFILAIAIVVAVGSGIVYRILAPQCPSEEHINGKTVIITGSSAGIGKSAAEELARRGGRIILACRNLDKAQKVADKIIETTGNSAVLVMKLDVSNLTSVKKFAKNFREREKKLDILINNAGCTSQERKLSPQGFELCYATNHLGHFLLTNLLLDMIKSGDGGRIINVTSYLHVCTRLCFDDIQFQKRNYSQLIAYSQSKLCNIYFTKELARRLADTGVTANCVHPGTVQTEISEKDTNIFRSFLLSIAFRLFGKDSTKGAQTTIYLTVAKEVSNITGEYFVDCKISESSGVSKKMDNAQRLWDISEKQISESTF